MNDEPEEDAAEREDLHTLLAIVCSKFSVPVTIETLLNVLTEAVVHGIKGASDEQLSVFIHERLNFHLAESFRAKRDEETKPQGETIQ